MMKLSILAAAAMAATVGLAEGAAEGLPSQTLWKKGDAGVTMYRIPALCTAPNGDLVAVCDAREKTGSDLHYYHRITTVCRRSSDGGRTWSEMAPTWKWAWDASGEWSASDPSMIVDSVAKKIFLMVNVWNWAEVPGHDSTQGVYRFFVQESSDNGVSWSEPREITKDLAVPGWPVGRPRAESSSLFITSGTGCQLKDGTLLNVIVHVGDGVALIGSTDHGKTWRPFGRPAKPTDVGDESKVVELPDGSLMINSRWKPGGRQVHVSRDRGMTWESTWDSALLDPACNAQLMRVGDRLLFLNCKSLKRENLHLRTSADLGRTWDAGLCVCPGSTAYSDMTVLPNGDIGILYERDNYSRIDFTTVPKARLGL